MTRQGGSGAIRNIALVAMLTAVITGQQVALSFLPNIELVSLFVILFTRHFGKRTLLVIYVFAVLQGLIYGFGLWMVNYLYVWTILYLVAYALRGQQSPFVWAVVLGGFGLLFGALCSPVYLFIGGIGAMAAFFIGGIPFDLLHAAGNFVAALLLFRPLDTLFTKLKKQYPFF